MTSQSAGGRSAVLHTNTNTQTHSTSDRDNGPQPPAPPLYPCQSVQVKLHFPGGSHSTTTAPGFHPRPRRYSDTSGCSQLAVKVEGVGGGWGREGEEGGREICIPAVSAAGGARDLDSGDTRARTLCPSAALSCVTGRAC